MYCNRSDTTLIQYPVKQGISLDLTMSVKRTGRISVQNSVLFAQFYFADPSLSPSADSQCDWTPHRVELCLWAWAVANQLQLPLVRDFNLKASLNDTSDSDTDHRPTKKQKTK